MVGSDTGPTEVIPSPDPDLVVPVHQELIMKNGIFNLENMDLEQLASEKVYEFLFIFTPLRLVGASGSPGKKSRHGSNCSTKARPSSKLERFFTARPGS